MLLPFGVGAILAGQATIRFEKWGYPLSGRGDLRSLDERQRLEFLEAQAKAQRFYVVMAIGVSAWLQISSMGIDGYSWFFGLQVMALLTSMFSALPTALMIGGESELEDEE